KVFYGCSKYPECDFISWNEPSNVKCPKCGGITVKKIKRKQEFYECIDQDCKDK
ncbi:DNA topoisomerase, partial [Candidatus Arthromitus sp. SFB-1]